MSATADDRSRWRARGLRALDGCAWAALLLGALATLHTVGNRVAAYDEGIVLTGANEVLHGRWPGRDFYTNYGPATYFTLAWLWKLGGASMWMERALGVLTHFIIAGLSGQLAGRLLRRPFLPLAAAATLWALVPFGVGPYAFLMGLAALLGAALLVARARRRGASAGAWAGAGVALGLVAAFRHDVFVWACLFALPPAGWVAGRAWRRGELPSWIKVAAFGGGVALPIAIFWGPILVHGDLHRLLADYVWDQARWVLPARKLPLPRELSFTTAVVVGAATGPLWAFALFALAGAALDRWVLAAVAVAWAAVFPHVIGRTDLSHGLYVIAPTLIVACALLQLLAARSAATGGALALLLAAAVVLAATRPGVRPPRFDHQETVGRGAPVPFFLPAAKRAALAFIDANSAPGDPLYVGCFNHRRVILNDMDLYYLADRVGIGRWMQFDPGSITRAEVQEEVVADFKRTHPPVAVLGLHCWWPEPNRSREPGATLLDAYIRSNYEVVQKVEPYVFIKRLPGANDEIRRR
jgi:hypothetical protein